MGFPALSPEVLTQKKTRHRWLKVGSAGGWQKGTLRACRGGRKPLFSERMGVASVYCFTAVTTAMPPTTQLTEAGVTGLQPQIPLPALLTPFPASPPSTLSCVLVLLPHARPQLQSPVPGPRHRLAPVAQTIFLSGTSGSRTGPDITVTWRAVQLRLPASLAAGGPAPGFLVQRALMLLAWGPPCEEPLCLVKSHLKHHLLQKPS